MRKPEVLAVTGLCGTSIYNMVKRGTFPASKKLGLRAVGWLSVDIYNWIDTGFPGVPA